MAVHTSAAVMRRASGFRAGALSTTILVTLLAAPGNAQETFTGAVNQDWDTATANWNPGPFFSNNDDAIFDTVGGTVSITEGGGITSGNITVNAGASGLVVDGNDLTIAGSLDVNGAATTAEIQANVAGGLNATGSGALVLSGTVGGTVSNSGTGTTTIANTVDSVVSTEGLTIVDNGGVVTNSTTVNGGEVNTLTGSTLTGDTTVNPGGTLDIDDGTIGNVDNDGGTVEISGGTVATLDNTAGDTTIDGGDVTGATNVIGGTVDQSGGTLLGTVTVNGGTLTTTGGTIQGDLTQTLGATNLGSIAEGDVTNDGGAFTLNTGGEIQGTLNNNSAFSFSDGTVNNVENTGTFTVVGDQSIGGTFNNTGTLESTGGDESLTTAGDFTTSGDVVNNGTSFTISSSTINVEAGATFNGVGELDGSIILDGEVNNAASLNVSGDITLADTLTNTGTLDITAEIDGATNDINNDGGTLNVDAGGSVTNVGTLTNQNGGAVTIDDTTAVSVADVTNTGAGTTMTVEGTLDSAGDVTNEADATLTVNATGTVNATVVNTATLNLNDGTITTLDNNTSGTVDVAGGTLTNNATNDGTLNVNSGTLTVNGGAGILTNESNGDILIADTATLDGSIINDSEVDHQGEITGNLTNNGAGEVNFSTASSVGGDLVNDGEVLASGDVTVAGALTNNGDLELAGNISTAEVVNAGNITTTGGVSQVDGNLASTGTVTVGAGDTLTVSGLTSINAGAFTNNGTFLGDAIIDAGASFDSGGASVFGDGTQTLTNNGSTFFNVNGNVQGNLTTLSGTTALNADVSGTLTTDGGVVTSGNSLTFGSFVQSAGVFNVGSGSTVTGNLTMTGGSLNLVDNPAPASNFDPGSEVTTLNVGGDATFAGTLSFDVSLAENSTIGDNISVAGNIGGSASLAFNTDGAEGSIDGIDLITYGGTNNLTVTGLSGLPLFGEFEYFVSDTGGNLTLQSQVNSGIASLASSVGVTQTIVGSIINRPTSPYVTDLATDAGERPCGSAGWARITVGEADADGSFFDKNSGSGGTTPVDLDYQGIQLGGDIACFDDRFFDGFDMAFGLIAGYNTGDTDSIVNTIDTNSGLAEGPTGSITSTDFDQIYGGVYATAAKGRFFADLQLRFEHTDFESTNREIIPGAGFDLDDSDYDTSGMTFSGAVGYAWPIESVEGLNFVGTVGFSYSDFDTSTIDIGEDGDLALENSTLELGFVSGTLARSRVLPDQISAINYFGTLTLYEDFADNPEAVFIDSVGNENPIALTNLGGYGEISVGVNYVRLLSPGTDGGARQLSAAARLDYRNGGDVESFGLTGQIRLQF